MLTGNKGEWSEIYTLLKIITDKELFAGDSESNVFENLSFPVVKILRDEPNGIYEYSYSGDLIIINNSKEEFRIPLSIFKEKVVFLLSELKATKTATFSIEEIESFINSFNCFSLKAHSSSKSDIRIVIHDQRTGTTPELGFSIKSQLGAAATLFNAGKTTNFIYKIESSNITTDDIFEINSINTKSKIKDRIEKIRKLSGVLKFVNTENIVFGNNLRLIDSALPQIVSEIIYLFYTSTYAKTIDLVDQITIINPLKYNLETNHPFYSYKIKRFLSDIALGMMPSRVWSGQLDTTGGYLVVKENGEIVCYHIYNRNEFENYLLKNTKLETASSSRHNFGIIYEEDNELRIKLNLQIRFIK